MQDKYFWPPKCTLSFYRRGAALGSFTNRRLDLSDTLMLQHDANQLTVEFGLVTESRRWLCWDEKNLAKIEDLIRYDLGFDGYAVTIRRCAANIGMPCDEEFRWKLWIRLR
ncbi:hypothetical protein [Methylobacterium sp. WL30]|uniref:hypothetical protein n=1 Tax=Methylobacterium sp. WL30 TaxID=2603895 RepID=UPI0011D6A78E|nr:hypothetical protein [Methylobacterium sp. WL30]TXN26231.1 hypothetical protein FV225_23680 [Methylobacterium sp. WL93]